jgi:hypothetical protein
MDSAIVDAACCARSFGVLAAPPLLWAPLPTRGKRGKSKSDATFFRGP